MRADEHEGSLNNTEVKREMDKTEARAREIIFGDLATLSESESFIRWFGKYLVPALRQDVPVNNGSFLAHSMGRRQLVLQQLDEFDSVAPGFLGRVLEVREQYEIDLRRAAQKE